MIRVVIDIEENGNPVVYVEGAVGESCYEITESLERLGKVTGDERTEAFYEQDETRVLNTRGR